jgi:hypothetical protein
VIRRDQPYGAHVKDLFEVQDYPEGDPPYDVAGWTLPMLLGLRKVEVVGKLEGPVRKADSIEAVLRGFGLENPGSPDMLDSRDSDHWREVFRRLQSGMPVAFQRRGDAAGGFRLVSKSASDPANAEFLPIPSMPRVGLYSPWSGSMDEGWSRWVFEQAGLSYVTVRNEMLRAGRIADFLDVLVIPSIGSKELDQGRALGSAPPEFTGGLDPEGAVAVEEFVRGGGKLVAIGSSSRWAVDLLRLPLVDLTALPENKEFSCPGSILRAIPEAGDFTAGLPGSMAVFSTRSPAWREMNDKEREAAGLAKGSGGIDVLLRYAPTRLLLSGWIQKPEVVAGQAAWVRARHGRGSVHLFGFRPQYRGWTQGCFQLLYRAILFE